jgi:hypothetical protein
MKPKRTDLTSIVSVVAALVSLLAAGVTLAMQLGASYQLLIVAIAVALAFSVGVFSARLARAARRIPHAPRVFLSYSHDDAGVADRIAALLRGEGARVWMASEQLKPGQDLLSSIARAISQSSSFVAILTPRSSKWIDKEIVLAQQEGVPIIPVLFDQAQLPPSLAGTAYIDLTLNEDEGYRKLVEAST